VLAERLKQRIAVARAKTKYVNAFVMPGLDPGIHRSSQKFFQKDGLPGRTRQ
jgi:hypothetical protein